MQQIDIRIILHVLVGKIKWIILSTVLCAALLASYAAFLTPMKYTSQITLLASNYAVSAGEQNATATGLTASQMLANTYVVVLQNPVTLSRVRKGLPAQYRDVTDATMKAMLNISAEADTSVLRIDVTGQDASLVKSVSTVLAEVAPVVLKEEVDTGSAKTLGNASTVKPVSRGTVKKGLIGALVGLMASAILIVIRYMLDTTIKGVEDIKQHVDVPVLGEIPSFSSVSKGGRR